MRRKNGYTLTEILVVILLLAVVGGIIIFNVNTILNKNKAKSYEKYIANVKSSAETYASLNLDKVSDLYENKSFTYITAGELIDQGFLDEKTTNPYTNQRIGRDELIKLSLSTETGDLTVTYPATEDNKEVFLSSVVLSTTVDKVVDCMDGVGTYQLALSDETGKLILDKNTLLNEYNFTCKLPEGFTKTQGTMNNEIGSTNKIGTYEIDYYWVSKSGTRGTGKRFLKIVPDTITVTYDVGVKEGNPVETWTNATCVGKISTIGEKKICTKEVLVGYNYNTLSRPIRTGYNFIGWYREEQVDPENPGNGIAVTANNKVVDKTSHTIYAHWDRKRFTVSLDSTHNGIPAVTPGTTEVEARYNLPLPKIEIPTREFTVSFNLNDSSSNNGTTEGTSDYSEATAHWNFDGYYTTDLKEYINAQGYGTNPWTELSNITLVSKWSDGRITLPGASRPGYDFVGWYSSTGVERDNSYQYEGTTELLAHWNPKTYVITLDYQTDDGGSTPANESVTSINQVFDNKFDDLFDASRNGYTFLGWFTEDGRKITRETRATNEYGIIDHNGITLYAHWEKRKFTLDLNVNPQSDMSHDIMMEKDSHLIMTFDTTDNNEVGSPYVMGWNFLGWYTEDNVKVFDADGKYDHDNHTYFATDGRWKYIGNVELFAKWEQKVYSLTIDLNPDVDKMSFNPELSDGSTKYEYIMTFDSPNNNHIPYGVLAGWKFLGWYDENNNIVYDSTGTYVESTSTSYFASGRWGHEGDLSLKAKWEQKPITIALDKNDTDLYDKPTLEKDAYVFTYDEPITENIVVPSYLDGYEFLGWYDEDTLVFNVDGSINEGATSYFNGNKWIKAEDIILKAKWKANGYVVTLNQTDATKKGTETVSINYNTQLPNVTIPERKYSITYDVNDTDGSTRSTEVSNIVKEWTFDGYFTESNNQYYNGSGETTIVYHEARNLDLYAHWLNGTLENMPTPTRVGYTFKGWYTDTDYNNKVENGYTVTEDLNLYAKWEANQHKIMLDNNKASVEGTTELPVTFDEIINPITPPIKIYTITLDKNYDVDNRIETKTASWVFKGYYTQPNGHGDRYFDAEGNINQTYTFDEDLQLYAYYEGGTINLPEYTREDYIFKGWYDSETNEKVEESNTYESNKVLKIKWNSEEYNLNLVLNKPPEMTSTTSLANDEYRMAMHTTNNNVINVPSEAIGWKFLGWYAGTTQVFNKDGEYQTSATNYFDAEGNWIKKDNVILKGEWAPISYPLTLSPGDLSPEPNIPTNAYTLIYDNPGLTSVSIPDRYIGYSFDGYFLDDEMIYDASGNRVNNNSVFDLSGNVKIASAVTLVAHWTEYPNTLQLVVDMLPEMKETPRLANSRYEMEKDSAVNNLVNVPSTVTGFDFLGWYANDEQVYDSTGMHVTSSYFDESGKWLKEDGARLVSKYEPVVSYIRLTENDQTVIDRNLFTATYGSGDPEEVAVPEELEQYEFKGWYYGSTMVFDESGHKNINATQFFDSNGDWMYIGNIDLVAKWEPLNIKITLDLNDDGLPFEPQVTTYIYTMEYNGTANNHINIPTNIDSNYSFQGWFDGDTQVYDETGSYNSTASSYFNPDGKWVRRTSVTLKAKWIKL